MKVIISHDVDHLFRNDHYKDLIYPKLWVRSTLELLKRQYGVKEWFYRMINPFCKVRHHIPEVLNFDREHGIESTFFFGMSNGLGMSYSIDAARETIQYVLEQNFDVGVHGIAYNSFEKIKIEYNRLKKIIGTTSFGIRTHYVRFDNSTFKLFDECGYLFDTSKFDKANGSLLEKPYKVGSLWEFPLAIMDGYLPLKLEEKKSRTLDLIRVAEERNLPYLTILFHDYQFCKGYSTERDWYIWIVEWLKKHNYEFISYKNAILEMEKGITYGK